jgi:hypothetical protein
MGLAALLPPVSAQGGAIGALQPTYQLSGLWAVGGDVEAHGSQFPLSDEVTSKHLPILPICPTSAACAARGETARDFLQGATRSRLRAPLVTPRDG